MNANACLLASRYSFEVSSSGSISSTKARLLNLGDNLGKDQNFLRQHATARTCHPTSALHVLETAPSARRGAVICFDHCLADLLVCRVRIAIRLISFRYEVLYLSIQMRWIFPLNSFVLDDRVHVLLTIRF